MGKQSNTKDFIAKAIDKHGDEYSYENVDYKNSLEKVEITCRDHGSFFQRPSAHLTGKGCSKCVGKHISLGVSSNTIEFVTRSNIIHNKRYDYSETEYVSSTKLVKITCKDHGIFEVSPSVHLLGANCPTCSKESGSSKRTSSTRDFIIKATGAIQPFGR